ncbi:unnamed protein product [Chrysoparadoxa australica]
MDEKLKTMIEEDHKSHPQCHYSSSMFMSCSSINGERKCEKVKKVIRHCPGEKPYPLVSESKTDAGEQPERVEIGDIGEHFNPFDLIFKQWEPFGNPFSSECFRCLFSLSFLPHSAFYKFDIGLRRGQTQGRHSTDQDQLQGRHDSGGDDSGGKFGKLQRFLAPPDDWRLSGRGQAVEWEDGSEWDDE